MLQLRSLEEIWNVPHLVVVLLPSLTKMMLCDSVKRGLKKQSAPKS